MDGQHKAASALLIIQCLRRASCLSRPLPVAHVPICVHATPPVRTSSKEVSITHWQRCSRLSTCGMIRHNLSRATLKYAKRRTLPLCILGSTFTAAAAPKSGADPKRDCSKSQSQTRSKASRHNSDSPVKIVFTIHQERTCSCHAHHCPEASHAIIANLGEPAVQELRVRIGKGLRPEPRPGGVTGSRTVSHPPSGPGQQRRACWQSQRQ